MIRRIFILSVVVLVYLVFSDRNTNPIVHPAGILVPESPLQKSVPESVFGFDDYIVTRKASFEIKARVLSSEPYYFQRESDLSPIDHCQGQVPARFQVPHNGLSFRVQLFIFPP